MAEGWTASRTSYALFGFARLGRHHELGRVDGNDFVLLFQLLHEQPFRRAAGHEAAHHVGIGLQHADPLALLLGHRAERTDQFVFGGKAPVNEGNNDFLQSASEGHAEEDLVVPPGAVTGVVNVFGHDAVAGLGDFGLLVEAINLVDVHYHHPTLLAEPLELFQHVEEVDPRLDIRVRYFGADVGVDQHGALDLELVELGLELVEFGFVGKGRRGLLFIFGLRFLRGFGFSRGLRFAGLGHPRSRRRRSQAGRCAA